MSDPPPGSLADDGCATRSSDAKEDSIRHLFGLIPKRQRQSAMSKSRSRDPRSERLLRSRSACEHMGLLKNPRKPLIPIRYPKSRFSSCPRSCPLRAELGKHSEEHSRLSQRIRRFDSLTERRTRAICPWVGIGATCVEDFGPGSLERSCPNYRDRYFFADAGSTFMAIASA